MSTAAHEELVEWVDDDDVVIGSVPRSRMRAENLLHRSVAVIVTTSDGRLVVQRRAATKDVYPGWWDIGAGGVITAGEDPRTAARRELYEELGIDADPEFVAIERFEDDRAREICRVYRLVHDGPFRPVDGEAVEIRAVDAEQFATLAGSARFLPGSVAMLLPHVPRFAGVGIRWSTVHRIEFTIEPFVEARPGAHVTAPVDALTAMGVEVDVGPFGSGCDVTADRVGEVVATVVQTAIGNGATHINLDVSTLDERTVDGP